VDPLTLAVDVVVGLAFLILIIGIREVGANVPGANDLGKRRTSYLPRIRTNELLALRILSIVGVPLLMIVFSVAVPALGNPLFLIIGALVGSFLPSFWLNGSRFGRTAMVVALVLVAICFVLVLMLQST
jgi:hypothetical protein